MRIPEGSRVTEHWLTLPDIGTLFILATEAKGAAGALQQHADELLVGIPTEHADAALDCRERSDDQLTRRPDDPRAELALTDDRDDMTP